MTEQLLQRHQVMRLFQEVHCEAMPEYVSHSSGSGAFLPQTFSLKEKL
jgi:hypothetical protein